MQLHDGSGRNGLEPLMSEINVTPFVDVMLVLLVIFMITAPMVATGIDVDLPQSRTPSVAADSKPVEISIDKDGTIFLGKQPVEAAAFPGQLQMLATASGDPGKVRVFVRAARGLDYGYVISVVGQVADAGFVKVAFLTDAATTPDERAVP